MKVQFLVFFVLLSSSCSLARPESPMDRKFEEFGKRFVGEFPAFSPVSATLLGDHRFDAKVDEVSAEARSSEAAFCRRMLKELETFQRDELSKASQIDAELLENELRSSLWRLEEFEEWAWNPTAYTRLAGNSIYGLMARDFASRKERLHNVTERLKEFPRLLEQVRKTLVPARVPKIHAETAVKQNRGVLSILDHMVKPHLGELSPEGRKNLEQAIETARGEVEKQQEWLEKELLPKAEGNFRIGAELYDKKLAFALHSPLTREEIRKRAESEMKRVRSEMYEISKGVYKKEHPYTKFPQEPSRAYEQAIIRAALEMAYQVIPGRDEIVETAKRSLVKATEFVREKDLVTIPPDPVEIIIMPEFRRGVSLAYCDSPGPLDVGQKTFYAVAPLPEDWTDKQVRSFLREYNLYSINDLTIHEAMPGHFLQLAHSNRYPSTLRAILSSGPFIEGWAVYTEQMMADQGFSDRDPLQKLIALKWYLRGIGNAIIDQAIHAGDMARDEALELMIEDTFQEEREAAAKWVRAQLTSAQLSTYFVGYLEHEDLLREVKEAWGEKFNLKEYHDKLLSFGSPPVQFVRALLLDLPIPGQGK